MPNRVAHPIPAFPLFPARSRCYNAPVRLIDRYVLRELVVPFGIGIAVAVMLLIGTMLFRYAEDIITKGVPITLVFKLMLLETPMFSVIAMPMAMAFAASLSINRLSRDSELTPMRMAGLPFRRIIASILIAGVIGSGLSFIIADRVAPWASKRANRILHQMVLKSVAPTAQPHTFVKSDDNRWVIYVQWLNKLDANRFMVRQVLIYDTRGSSFPVLYAAQQGITSRRYWTLTNVAKYELARDGSVQRVWSLPELKLDLEKDIDFFAFSETSDEMSCKHLREEIRSLQSSGAGGIARRFQVDLHFRYALPFACLVFGLISAPISFRFSRGGTFVGVLVSIIISFLYWNAMILSKVLGANGVVPPALAAWAQNAAFGCIAAFLVWRTG